MAIPSVEEDLEQLFICIIVAHTYNRDGYLEIDQNLIIGLLTLE